MLRTLLILALIGAALASYPTKKCYQCEYVPPKEIERTVYDVEEVEEEHPHTRVTCSYEFEFYGKEEDIENQAENDCTKAKPNCVHETTYKVVKTTRKVPRVIKKKTRAGGFEACKGPITPLSAKLRGVDDWICHDNCYVRTDSYGRISRGCYKDELNVDPNLLDCNKQGGYTYCFCKGSLCNGDNPQQDSQEEAEPQVYPLPPE